ncbi:metal-dependent hydrolase [gamma proteobacterium HTCC5015]|nr:metal-dependent hydrolase [gamma proteobacterium HTCC5015]
MFKKAASHTDTPLIQRKVSFDFSNTPLHWIPGDAFSSHFISVIHTILPAGEFFFCKLYNKALPYIEDEQLREDVKGFIKQEAMHARAHDAGIAEFLEAQGMEVRSFIANVEWFFDQLLHDQPFGQKIPDSMEKAWLKFRLGIIAAVEHFTCVLGKYALDNTEWDEAGGDPVVLDLLRWHGAEEVEHRSVAFDVYKHLGGRYPMRYFQMFIVFPVLMGLWAKGSTHMMAQDPLLAGKKPRLLGLFYWMEWQRVARTERLPSLFWLAKQASHYFVPWYDPVKEASTEQAQAYLATSPAAAKFNGTPLKAVKVA